MLRVLYVWPVQGVSVLRGWLCSVAWRGLPVVPVVPIPAFLSANVPPLSCRARFLENLAAAQKEKISSMAKGRLDVFGDATLEHPTALAWDRDGGTPEPGMEPPSISRCYQGVCS